MNTRNLAIQDQPTTARLVGDGRRLKSVHQQIDPLLFRFLDEEVLPLVGIDSGKFWQGFVELVNDFTVVNRALLARRDQLQQQIDDWHRSRRGEDFDADGYEQFLRDIGYLQDEVEDFMITTDHLDAEIHAIPGPQLVVPVKNARFALNAANARWASLYDALYGSDAIPRDGELAPGRGYNPVRGRAVIEAGRDFLDQCFPLATGSHRDVCQYTLSFEHLVAFLPDGSLTGLKNPGQLVAFDGDPAEPRAIVLRNHGLHVELDIDRGGKIGANDRAGIDDIQVEAAVTAIMDGEDSVAAVDVEDKLEVYRNWLGLMRGDLCTAFEKDGSTVTRTLERDRVYTGVDGGEYRLSGRALMLVRTVGSLMNTELVRDENGDTAPEGIVDTVIASLIGMLDLRGGARLGNSRTGSIYIVRPKMHGPEEVRFVCDLFCRVEHLLGLPANTLKLGIMDEERRTTLNLKRCIREAQERVFFINTGFLDRTGDEIHTSMEAGPFLPRARIREQPWLDAYERRNVAIGLDCGFRGRAQIGKGMWAMPDEMARMMTQKIGHPRAGAGTAWVPSPTAAALHALHYHQVDVKAVQGCLRGKFCPPREALLQLPLLEPGARLSDADVTRELESAIQGILGYVVRWVDQGIGCSKVPDIDDIALMEDRATLRISSQLLANWLHHEICNEAQVLSVMTRMAAVVDRQNADDPAYRPMAADTGKSLAFQTAKALILEGRHQPNGYTEPLLHAYRRQAKQQAAAKNLNREIA